MPTPIPASKLSGPICNIPIPISVIAFQHLASKPDHEVYNVSLRDIEQDLKSKVKTDHTLALLEPYTKFLKVFSYGETKKLPPHCPRIDYTIYM